MSFILAEQKKKLKAEVKVSSDANSALWQYWASGVINLIQVVYNHNIHSNQYGVYDI